MVLLFSIFIYHLLVQILAWAIQEQLKKEMKKISKYKHRQIQKMLGSSSKNTNRKIETNIMVKLNWDINNNNNNIIPSILHLLTLHTYLWGRVFFFRVHCIGTINVLTTDQSQSLYLSDFSCLSKVPTSHPFHQFGDWQADIHSPMPLTIQVTMLAHPPPSP